MKSSLKLFNLVLIAGALCATGLRAQTIGGAAPQARPKKFSFGLGYANMQQRFKSTSANFYDHGTGMGWSDQTLIGQRLELDQNRVYLETGYGFGKNFELTGRLGLNVQNAKELRENFSSVSFSGLTVRWRFHEGEKIDFGLVVNGNYSSTARNTINTDLGSYMTGTAPSTTTVSYSQRDRNSAEGVRDGVIALPLEVKAGSRASFYVAPAYVRTAGRFHQFTELTTTTVVTTSSGSTTTTTTTAPIEFRAHITRLRSVGGYLGFRFGDAGWQFNVEGAYINGVTGTFGFRRVF